MPPSLCHCEEGRDLSSRYYLSPDEAISYTMDSIRFVAVTGIITAVGEIYTDRLLIAKGTSL